MLFPGNENIRRTRAGGWGSPSPLYAPFITQGLSNLAGDIAARDIKNEWRAGCGG